MGYEYVCVKLPYQNGAALERRLNELGAEGWQFVSHLGNFQVFMRPKGAGKATPKAAGKATPK